MKITKVEVIAPKKNAGSGSQPVFCRVSTDEGVYGYGEAQLAIGVGAASVYEAIRDFGPMILGMDPLHHEVIWEKLRRDSFWGIANGIILMAAISAVDIALWDIKGKFCGLPLYQLLGGKFRESMRCYASQAHFGWGVDHSAPDNPQTGSPAWFALVAKNAEAEGFDAIKIGILMHDKDGGRAGWRKTTNLVGRDMLKLAEARLSAVREACPDMDIILENHAYTDAGVTIQMVKIAEKYDVLLIEEATAPLNPAVMRRIADSTCIPIASGEHTVGRWGFLPFLENGSLAVLQPDIGTCGGITEMKKICDMAHTYDVSIQGHVCTGPVSYLASLHLEAAIPNFYIHEHHISCAGAYMTGLGTWAVKPKDGYISVPDLPGIGMELSEEALRDAQIAVIS